MECLDNDLTGGDIGISSILDGLLNFAATAPIGIGLISGSIDSSIVNGFTANISFKFNVAMGG